MWQNYGYQIIFHGWTSNHKKQIIKICQIRNISTNIGHRTVDSLEAKIKFLETENKLLKDDIKNKQKLIDSILEHNSNLIQAQNVFVENHFVTRKVNDKIISCTNTNNALQNDKKNESNVPKDDRFKELQVSFKDLVVIQLKLDLILEHQGKTWLTTLIQLYVKILTLL